MPPVYRAPMRSRHDDVDPGLAVERALSKGVVGTGGLFFLGRITGEWRYDPDPAAAEADLVHVRDCSCGGEGVARAVVCLD